MFDFEESDICMYLKFLVGYKFLYQNKKGSYKIYCYSGKFWKNDDILLRNCISTSLHNFLEMLIVKFYNVYDKFHDRLKSLKSLAVKKK